MSKINSQVSLTLDECLIKILLDYDGKSGLIIGESTFSNLEGDAIKALVFVHSGVSTVRWKQVVAYYYTPKSYDGTNYAPIRTDILGMFHDFNRYGIPKYSYAELIW
ncbi:unnamed protein product [Lepeophtheirus salmonis]|uniref:(salmon louse) hypothetical protein n=1 Tax=Lepeophtheirus salmonis TaxID=72036 RepID=A0A7R8HAR8_LEPSM|nr:unnamed protein product [Lepeophtheirus salmonis]CAF2979555.1 unnamed protein product [Lepeophtheirus salmonis]